MLHSITADELIHKGLDSETLSISRSVKNHQ